MARIRVGGAALNQTPLDWSGNRQRIEEALEEARRENLTFLCLPELCLTGYGCEDWFLAPWVAEKAWDSLQHLLPKTRGLFTNFGLPLWYEGHCYNCVALVADGAVVAIAAKHHLANDGVHYEPRWFSSWPLDKQGEWSAGENTLPFGDVRAQWAGQTIAFEICEDAWRDQARTGYHHAQQGARLLFNPSASHFAFQKTDIREKLVLQGSRLCQGIYLYANLLGNEAGKMIYDGEIMVAQNGNMIQMNDRLSFGDWNLTWTEIDTEAPENTPRRSLKHYSDTKETEFYEAVTLGLFDYLRKARSKGFVVSLSGGADSAMCATMVATMVQRGVDELGLERFNQKLHQLLAEQELAEAQTLSGKALHRFLTRRLLTCVYQGTRHSSLDTYRSARTLADSLGAEFHYWRVDDVVAAYTEKAESALKGPLTWEENDITLQNIQARSRAPGIWMLANAKNALLLATSNRSEADVGYATMDGDTAGSISPIAGVDKPFIRSWLRYAEQSLGYEGLRAVNSLQPTAELRPTDAKQTDEQDLMPYRILYEIEKLAIGQHLSPVQVYRELEAQELETSALLKKHILRFFRLWSRNQWKRERYAPAFHLDDFNVDPRTWCRFPILSASFGEELAELENTE